MNSHDSHDPDFPQEILAIPDAEVMTPPDGLPADGPLDAEPQDAEPQDQPFAMTEATDVAAGEPSVVPESPMPEPPVQAAEVWTELDEAEPAAIAGDWSRETAPWSGARVEERGEPDPSVLDAGSGPRREAEKPGRTVLPYDDWEPSEVPYQPKQLGIIDQLMILLADGATMWRKVLRQVRTWLPRTWQRNLSDELMTAIALGILILWLVLWNPLGGRNTASRVVVEEPNVSGPALSSEGNQAGTSASLAGEGGASAPAITAEPPAEALEPSPEQTLIADIQERVSKISRSYAVGLIQSVEVNLPQQVLAVNVSNDWYGLGAESQDRIAQDIYTQSEGLTFATLQLRDPDGVVVARNPVVGPTMVILKRHRPAEGDPLA